MFKGLKSKLEDSSKKLQASVQASVQSVQQYGEQFTQQVRNSASDAGSDSGASITNRFSSTVGASGSDHGQLNFSTGNAIMEEVEEGDLLGIEFPKRERTNSGSSHHSMESSLSSYFQSVPGMTSAMDAAYDSDNDSVVDKRWSESLTGDQFSNVFGKLQGRAVNYRGQYRELTKQYNSLVEDFNKHKKLMTKQQDTFIEKVNKLRTEKKNLTEAGLKMKKYEDMLDKCKAKIIDLEDKKKKLVQENDELKAGMAGDSGMSDLAVERVAADWRQLVEKVESDWVERSNKIDSDHAIQLATAKAEMHAALEKKDGEIESLRSKCRGLEIQDGQANERWQTKVDELQSVVKALESEKTDMIEKLSAAKQQGVQAVRDEEEVRRKALLDEWEQKAAEASAEAEAKLEKLKEEHAKTVENMVRKEEYNKITKVLQLSELNAVKSSTTNTENDENSKITELEMVYKEKLNQLQAQLDSQTEAARLKENELAQSAEFNSQRQKSELEHLMKENEDMMEQTVHRFELERNGLMLRFENSEKENGELRNLLQQTIVDFENRAKDEYDERCEKENSLKNEIVRLEKLVEDGDNTRASEDKTEKAEHLKEVQSLAEDVEQLKDELQLKTIELEDAIKGALAVKEDCEENLNGMRRSLEEKTSNMRQLQEEKEQLEIELASSKELSAIHEHLRQELEDARQQQIGVELRVREMSERADSAEKALEKDRAELESCKAELEETIRLHNESKTDAVHELVEATTVQALTAEKALIDVSDESTAIDIRVTELEQTIDQLKTERDHLSEKLTTTSEAGSTAETKLEECLEDLRTNQLEKEELTNHLAVIQSNSETRIAESDQRALQAQNELAELTLNVNQSKENTAKLLSEKDLVEKELQDVRDTLLELQRQLEASSADGESELQRLTEQVNQKNAELQELKSKIETQEQLIQNSSEAILEHQNRVSVIEAALNEASSQLQNANSQLVTSQEKVAALESGLIKATNEAKRLEECVQKESSSQSESHKEILEQLKEKDQTLSELTEKLADAQKSASQLEALNDKLKQADEELEKRVADIKTMEELVKAEKERVDVLECDYQTRINVVDRRAAEAEETLQLTQEQLSAVKTKLQEKDDLQNIASAGKIGELEVLCERMRVEFIAKEKILSELRAELESVRTNAKEENLRVAQELLAANTVVEELKHQLESDRAEFNKQKEGYQTTQSASVEDRRKEKAEEEKIREQYSIALENLRSELASAQTELSAAAALQDEKTILVAELGELKTAHEDMQKTQKEAADEALAQLKLKAEKKIAKLKLSNENEVTAAKAELMLQVDELRASLSEKDRKLDEHVIEKAKMTQQLMSHEDLKTEVESRREKEKQLSAKITEVERKVLNFEAENRQLSEKKIELEGLREKLSTEVEEKTTQVAELTEKVASLEATNEESFRKAAAKQDNDSKKVVRELQREVKQLYVELNEKAEALDTARIQIETLSAHGSEAADSAANVQIRTSLDAAPDRDFMMEEELETTRRKLKECHREIDGLRETNGKLERNLESLIKKKAVNRNSTTVVSNNPSAYECGFADPAEAEYLKNVLFRYMAQREDLGKESVTLARVIATVAKFDTHQLQTVLSREESRVAGGWVGGTVTQMSNALSAATGATRHH